MKGVICHAGRLVKGFTLFLLVFSLFFINPGRAAAEAKLTVAAAADLSFALKDIAASFEKDTGTKVVLSFGSTGMLTRQIESGAPFDVFFAANAKYIDELKKGGYVMPETIKLYAVGRIALAVNKASGVEVRDLKDLSDPRITRVAIANPEHAPYGVAAMEALKSEGLWEKLKGKLVYGENIRQTLQFIQTGNAQAGIVALSVVDVPEIRYTVIDQRLHNPINQSVAVVSGSGEAAVAKDFIKYVLGPKGRPIMKKYGFILPE